MYVLLHIIFIIIHNQYHYYIIDIFGMLIHWEFDIIQGYSFFEDLEMQWDCLGILWGGRLYTNH